MRTFQDLVDDEYGSNETYSENKGFGVSLHSSDVPPDIVKNVKPPPEPPPTLVEDVHTQE